MGGIWKRIAIALAMLCAVVFFGLRALEKAMTFHPTRRAPGSAWNRPAGCEEV